MSIGGNDFGFANVVQACVGGALAAWALPGAGTTNTCSTVIKQFQKVGTEMLNDNETVHESANGNADSATSGDYLTGDGTYTICGCSGNRDFAVPKFATLLSEIAQRAPNSMIIIVGYPWIFPTNWESAGNTVCTIGFNRLFHYSLSPPNMSLITNGISAVDNALRTIVNRAAASGLNVRFADPRQAFFGHDVCEPDDKTTASPWKNQTDAWFNPVLFEDAQYTHPESLHPNARGQQAYAQLVEGCYASRGNCGSEPQPVQIALAVGRKRAAARQLAHAGAPGRRYAPVLGAVSRAETQRPISHGRGRV